MGSDEIGRLIRDLRLDKGWTQGQLAEKVGMDQGSISKRESGRHKQYDRAERRSFAKAFGLSVDEFDAKWRFTTPDVRFAVATPNNQIPVINRAPAGEVINCEEYGTDSSQGFEYIDRGQSPSDDALFAVIVAGDSMKPTLHNNDYVVFKPMSRYRAGDAMADGSVCFVRLDAHYEHGCMIARVRFLEEGKILLTKDNPEFKGIVVEREHVEQLAIAVERRSKSGLTPRVQNGDALHA